MKERRLMINETNFIEKKCSRVSKNKKLAALVSETGYFPFVFFRTSFSIFSCMLLFRGIWFCIVIATLYAICQCNAFVCNVLRRHSYAVVCFYLRFPSDKEKKINVHSAAHFVLNDYEISRYKLFLNPLNKHVTENRD